MLNFTIVTETFVQLREDGSDVYLFLNSCSSLDKQLRRSQSVDAIIHTTPAMNFSKLSLDTRLLFTRLANEGFVKADLKLYNKTFLQTSS